MPGKLFIVGTPIGNLGDFSPRAAETLSGVDFIAAEDTRVTLKLLNRFDIKKPMVSYHEHNQRERGGEIVGRLLAGETCALVTDAGMPAVSDPGRELVAQCHENGVAVETVPGGYAVTHVSAEFPAGYVPLEQAAPLIRDLLGQRRAAWELERSLEKALHAKKMEFYF